MRWPFTSIKNASGSPQIQSATRCGGSAFADSLPAAREYVFGGQACLRRRPIKWHFAE